MDQVQNMELSKDQIIQELIALLNQNQQKEAANDVFEMATLIDGMGKRLEQVTEELSSVRKQLEKMEQEKADKTLKANKIYLEGDYMKKLIAVALAIVCVLGLIGCGQRKQTVIGIPDTIDKVEVSFYSMGQVTEWELDESKLPAWKEWAENLSLKPLSEEKIEELKLTDGGESYHFEINNDEMSFTFKDHGSDKYLVIDKTYYEVLNGTIPGVMKLEFYIVPVVSLVCGVILLKTSAMKINSIFGFRTKVSTKNNETWKYCNQLCAKILILIGIISIIAMLALGNFSALLFGVLELGELVNIIVVIAILLSIPVVNRSCKKKFEMQ